MEPELLDLFRRWLRRFGLLGTLASIIFGIYVELPVAVRAEQNSLEVFGATLERTLRQDERRALQQEHRDWHAARQRARRQT